MRRLFGIVLAILLIGPAAAQFDAERITDYASDITVAVNGQMTVVESISIISARQQIRHGIYRDFPTRYSDENGRAVRVRFDVVEVQRDGRTEPYTTESIDKGVRVKIGDADTEIEAGQHIYKITYVTERQIGFFERFDELYWNVTGNGWVFPIERARATVRLPEKARILQQRVYTGPQGSTGADAQSTRVSDNVIQFSTTRALGSYEGLTVAVGFSKGAVAPPSQAQLRREFILDHADSIVASLGMLAVIIYYMAVWWHVGRDPARGTIIPLFTPPANLSPAALRFIRRMSYDRKVFSAALIDMAVKGYLKITEENGTYTLTRTGTSAADASLLAGERNIANALFTGSRETIELKQTNHSKIGKAVSNLKSALKTEYEGNYFITNIGWFIGGLAILTLTGLGAALLSEQADVSAFMLLWLSGWTVGTAHLVRQAGSAWVDVLEGAGSRIVNIFSALVISAFSLPFVGGLLFGFFILGTVGSGWTMAALIAGGGIAYTFYHLLKAPTLAGAKLLDQIEGFAMYLSTTEKERLEMLHPPEVTPELFEKYLPYAIALDCENKWSKKFEAAAAAAGRTPDSNYSPGWYSGSSRGFGSAGFGSAIGSSLASAAASASTAPGSRSGSGGGGSSGGGGGGGGGGGW